MQCSVKLLLRGLVCLMVLALAIQGCGNKGELTLESKTVLIEGRDDLGETVDGADSDEDEKPPRKTRIRTTGR